MKVKSLLLSVVLAAVCWGCSDDDLPFQGTDNTINEFSLSAPDGNVYVAEIRDNVIELAVPLNVSLEGAKAEYSICEQSTILPDPAELTDWDQEREFTITSYNGESKVYSYRVIRNSVPSEGSVILRTQTDVAALATAGITVISGDLVIGDIIPEQDDPVTDLSPLKSIVEVGQNIIIRNSFAGTSLAGLDNIRTAAGVFIGDLSTPLETADMISVSLPGLKSVGQFVLNSEKVESMDFASLEDAGWMFISGQNLVKASFPLLKSCTTNLTVKQSQRGQNQVIESLEFPKLEKIGSNLTAENYSLVDLNFPALASVGGTISVSSMSKIENLGFPALNSIGGEVNIKYVNTLRSFDSSSLSAVGGNVTIDLSYAKELSKFGISSLKSVAGDLEIRLANNPDLTVLDLSSLSTLKGRLYLYQFDGKNIKLDNLMECPDIRLYYIYNVEELDFSKVSNLERLDVVCFRNLKSLTTKESLTEFTINPGQDPVEQFEIKGLKTVTKMFDISGMNNDSFEFGSVEHVGTLSMTSVRNLKSCVFSSLVSADNITIGLYTLSTLKFPKLKSVNENLSITNIRDMKGSGLELPMLEKVGGRLTVTGIWGNQSGFDSLEAFKNLKSAGSVVINTHPVLSDFTPLKNVAAGLSSASSWSVTTCAYNPTLEDMKNGKYKK